MLAANLLPQTATVLRFTPNGTDRRGHAKGTFQPHGTIACSLQALSGREVYAVTNDASGTGSGQTQTLVQYRVFCNADADVTESDRLLIDGSTYHVVVVNDPTGHRHHVELDLYRIKPSRV